MSEAPYIDDGFEPGLEDRFERFAQAMGGEGYKLYCYWRNCCVRDDIFVEPSAEVDDHIRNWTTVMNEPVMNWKDERN